MLTSCSRFRSFPFRSAFFRPLLFRFRLLSLCSFLSSFFLSPPHSGFSGAPFRSRFLAFPVLSGLISHAFLRGSCTRLSVCFLSPFPDSLPQLFLRCFPFAFAFGLSPSDPLSFVRFSSGSGYSASASSFPFFPALPHSCLSGAAPPPFGFLTFPLPFRPVSRASLPLLVLSFLFVSFRPSRFRSHGRFTGASLLLSPSGFPLAYAFFRPLSLGSDYSAFRSFLSLLPVLPCRRFLRCFFLFRPACFHAFLPIPVLGLLHFLSPVAGSLHSSYLSASALFLSVSGLFPLAFALGSGYLAWVHILFRCIPFALNLASRSELVHNIR